MSERVLARLLGAVVMAVGALIVVGAGVSLLRSLMVRPGHLMALWSLPLAGLVVLPVIAVGLGLFVGGRVLWLGPEVPLSPGSKAVLGFVGAVLIAVGGLMTALIGGCAAILFLGGMRGFGGAQFWTTLFPILAVGVGLVVGGIALLRVSGGGRRR
jgi:hypothetical protein